MAEHDEGLHPHSINEPPHLHVYGASTSHDMGVLQGSPHNHDGIMQAALCFINELLAPAPQHYGGSPGRGAAREQVVPLATNLARSAVQTKQYKLQVSRQMVAPSSAEM
jgi:hypothetical protein